MRDLENLQAERIRLLLVARGYEIRPDFLAAASLAVRAVNGMHISTMLHGPGPFEFDDIEGRKELTRILMRALGVEPDEAELAALSRERFDIKAARARAGGPPG
jgi:hypothetical protein